MTLKELIKSLVETEDQMERMNLVEQHKELLEEPEQTEPENTETEDWKTKYEELKKKYIDTFFNGSGDEKPEDTPEETEETEEKKPIKIDDLVKGGK